MVIRIELQYYEMFQQTGGARPENGSGNGESGFGDTKLPTNPITWSITWGG